MRRCKCERNKGRRKGDEHQPPEFATIIHAINGIISTIREEIESTRQVGAKLAISINETLDDGVVVAALQVIEPRINDVILPGNHQKWKSIYATTIIF